MQPGWDRLADATAAGSAAKLQLSIVTLGHVHAEDLVVLTPYFQRIEQLVLEIPPRDALALHRAEFNRAVDAATSDWVLVVRERETIDEALASEIVSAAEGAKARGFRIRSVPFYAGLPLRLEGEQGEVRLFHRRYYLRYANKGEWDELTIQGSVVRLANAFRSVTFESVEAHRVHLEERAGRVSPVGRVLRFLRYAVATGAHDRNTLRYLWTEAGFDIARAPKR
jgi:hypothetical protein